MKKTVMVITGLLAYTISPVVSQKVSFGLQGNLLISWMKSDDQNLNAEGMRGGYGYGLILDYNFAENYGLSTGLNMKSNAGSKIIYEDKNFKSDSGYSAFEFGGTIIPLNTQIAYKIQYVEIPLSLKLKTNEIGYLTYFGQFGFTPQILWKARGGATQTDVDITDEVRRIGIALNIGAGLHYSLGGKTYILAGIVYDNGLIDVTDKYTRYKNYETLRPVSETIKDKVNLNSLSLRLGVMF